MSSQIPDTFIWNGTEYVFLRAENIYTLFEPQAFGLCPSSVCSACWKGFVVHFRLDGDRICIPELEVYCEDGNYPVINGVRAYADAYDEFYVYKNLNLMPEYTGTITLGKDLLPQYMLSAFTGPRSYEETYELHFTDGRLTSWENSTGNYSWSDIFK